MVTAFQLVTNNPLVCKSLGAEHSVQLLDTDYHGVLVFVRNMVHNGYKILSHPLSGSVKPNETPYKSIMLSINKGSLDLDSLSLIEQAIVSCEKFGENRIALTDKLKDDFMLIDFSLISGAIS